MSATQNLDGGARRASGEECQRWTPVFLVTVVEGGSDDG
jgi:hypothetical protein